MARSALYNNGAKQVKWQLTKRDQEISNNLKELQLRQHMLPLEIFWQGSFKDLLSLKLLRALFP